MKGNSKKLKAGDRVKFEFIGFSYYGTLLQPNEKLSEHYKCNWWTCVGDSDGKKYTYPVPESKIEKL